MPPNTLSRRSIALVALVFAVGLLAATPSAGNPTAETAGPPADGDRPAADAAETMGTTPPSARGVTGDDVSIAVTNVTTSDGETGAFRLTLTEAPDGLAGYRATVVLQTAGVATVTNASYPERYEMTTRPVVSSDGRSVTLEAIDLGDRISTDASDVPLATVVVTGEKAGETAIDVTDVELDADGGDRVAPAVESGTVTVTTGSNPSTDSASGSAAESESDTEPSAEKQEPDEDGDDASGYSPLLVGIVLLAAALLVVSLAGRN